MHIFVTVFFDFRVPLQFEHCDYFENTVLQLFFSYLCVCASYFFFLSCALRPSAGMINSVKITALRTKLFKAFSVTSAGRRRRIQDQVQYQRAVLVCVWFFFNEKWIARGRAMFQSVRRALAECRRLSCWILKVRIRSASAHGAFSKMTCDNTAWVTEGVN